MTRPEGELQRLIHSLSRLRAIVDVLEERVNSLSSRAPGDQARYGAFALVERIERQFLDDHQIRYVPIGRKK